MKEYIDPRFIVFEGCEGSGKSTQARLLAGSLKDRGVRCSLTHEPGGTEYGKRIRQLLITKPSPQNPMTEFLLFEADRAEHRAEIQAKLTEGFLVISDRYSFSTFAYQGFGRKLFQSHEVFIRSVDNGAREGLLPGHVFLLDQPVEKGIARKRAQQELNRFEDELLEFHGRVREGFLKLAKEPTGVLWHIIDADRPIEAVHDEVLSIVLSVL